MNLNLLPSEQAAVLGVIDPDAATANTYTSDWADMGQFESVLAIILLGELGAEADIDAKLEQATDGDGTGVKDVTGKAVTTLTHSPVDSDKQSLINCRAEELDLDNDFRFVRLSITVATATSDIAGLLMGFNPRALPASDNDLASVDEIVT
jgi:hypothetical protein